MTAVLEGRALWDAMEKHYPLSPIHATLGLSLTVPGEGEAIITFDGDPRATNRRGDAAGGTLAQMIDSAVVQASRTRLGATDSTVTIELKVNYIRAAPANLKLSARGTLDHFGRTTAVGNARIEDESGKLYALGIVTVSIKKADA
jgi:uncharacterized protein (TIGR00369 family)